MLTSKTVGSLVPGTLTALKTWLRTAPKGQWCVYWEGYLALDAFEERARGAMASEYPARLVGPLVYHAYEAGDVDLFQVRVAKRPDPVFRYWARKR